jgi:hypothetical protein
VASHKITLFPIKSYISEYMMRALRDEDPGFCADSLLTDIEDFHYQKPISDKQLDKAYNLLISDKFAD